jgi:peptidoglycan/LPS O-acetylase OafA/YrhL
MGLTAIFSAIYVVFFKPPTSAFDLVAVALAALYVANFVLTFAGLRLGMLTPTWSLAVEEQFYTIWPLALSYLLRLKRKKILAIAAGLVVFGALLRAFMHYEGGRLMSWPLYAGSRHILFARADGLMCGAIVAMAASWGWLSEKFPKRFLVAAASASAVTLGMMLLFGPDDDKSLVYSTYVCASVLTGALIAGLVTAPPAWLSAILAWGPLVWIGKISYGLYLYHMPVFSLMPATPPSYLPAAVGPFAVYAFAFALTFAIATASYYLVEKRFLDLRHKLGAPRSAPQPELVLSR